VSLVPYRFLLRVACPCHYIKRMPTADAERLLDLPENCRIDNYAAMDERKNFADVRLAWNDFGLGVQVEVRGKEELPQGSSNRLRGSDGLTLWIDTRDARTSHRASRYCHEFHFLPTGAGPEEDEPLFSQLKINRALQDAPLASAASVPFRCVRTRHGYVMEAFLPAAVLYGFDPEQNPRVGFYYVVKDTELGEQVLSVGADFPYWEDPSLWSVLELVR
jgi:hypothetical protein